VTGREIVGLFGTSVSGKCTGYACLAASYDCAQNKYFTINIFVSVNFGTMLVTQTIDQRAAKMKKLRQRSSVLPLGATN
jgi:hypothetical protein